MKNYVLVAVLAFFLSKPLFAYRIENHLKGLQLLTVEAFQVQYQGVFPQDTQCYLTQQGSSALRNKSLMFLYGSHLLKNENPYSLWCVSKAQAFFIQIPAQVKSWSKLGVGFEWAAVESRAKVWLEDVGGKTIPQVFGVYHGVGAGIGFIKDRTRATGWNDHGVALQFKVTGYTGVHLNVISHFRMKLEAM